MLRTVVLAREGRTRKEKRRGEGYSCPGYRLRLSNLHEIVFTDVRGWSGCTSDAGLGFADTRYLNNPTPTLLRR